MAVFFVNFWYSSVMNRFIRIYDAVMNLFIKIHDASCEIRIRLISWVVFILIIAVLADMIFDYFGWINQPHILLPHLWAEGITIALLCGLLIYLQRLLSEFRLTTDNWQKRANNAESDANKWKHEAKEYLKGLSDAIDQQFAQWKFSKAEKEIGRLILKGISFKEIAYMRCTSERTVRQQALEIYKKSGMHGRAEFSAYFLEDLLFP